MRPRQPERARRRDPEPRHSRIDRVAGSAEVVVPGEEQGEPADEVTKEDRSEAAAGADHQRDRDRPGRCATNQSTARRRMPRGRCTLASATSLLVAAEPGKDRRKHTSDVVPAKSRGVERAVEGQAVAEGEQDRSESIGRQRGELASLTAPSIHPRNIARRRSTAPTIRSRIVGSVMIAAQRSDRT